LSKRKKQPKADLSAKQARYVYLQKLRPLLFAFVSWFVLLSVMHLPGIKDLVRYVMVSITHTSAIITGKLLFLPVADKGYPVMDFAGFSMQVILECTAYNFYLFVLMLTIFAKWPIRHKLVNLAIFTGVIFMVNNFRFIIMGAIGRYYPQIFSQIHDYFWNILFAILVFLIFLRAESRSGNRTFTTTQK
jgi:exosortase/archaeosortase family protein